MQASVPLYSIKLQNPPPPKQNYLKIYNVFGVNPDLYNRIETKRNF